MADEVIKVSCWKMCVDLANAAHSEFWAWGTQHTWYPDPQRISCIHSQMLNKNKSNGKKDRFNKSMTASLSPVRVSLPRSQGAVAARNKLTMARLMASIQVASLAETSTPARRSGGSPALPSRKPIAASPGGTKVPSHQMYHFKP